MRHIQTALLILYVSLITTWQYLVVTVPRSDITHTLQSIVDGTASPPFLYRVLTPHILNQFNLTVTTLTVFHFITFTLFFALLVWWSRQWRVNEHATVMIAALTVIVMLPTYYFSAYAVVEWCLFTAGLIALKRNNTHTLLYACLVICGTLNREMTGVLLLLAWFAWYPQRWRQTLGYGAVFVSVMIILRVSLGGTQVLNESAWSGNLTDWRLTGAILYNGILAPLWLALAINYRVLSWQSGRLIVGVVAPYLVLFLTMAIWQEVRLLMPLLIVGVPLLQHNQ